MLLTVSIGAFAGDKKKRQQQIQQIKKHIKEQRYQEQQMEQQNQPSGLMWTELSPLLSSVSIKNELLSYRLKK